MTPEQKSQHTNRLEGKIAQLESLVELLRFNTKTENSNGIIITSERMVAILVDISEKEESQKRIDTISMIDKINTELNG